jgi:hypothetical protein
MKSFTQCFIAFLVTALVNAAFWVESIQREEESIQDENAGSSNFYSARYSSADWFGR